LAARPMSSNLAFQPYLAPPSSGIADTPSPWEGGGGISSNERPGERRALPDAAGDGAPVGGAAAVWFQALTRGLGTPVRLIQRGGEPVRSGAGAVCRAMDRLGGLRPLCQEAHRAVHAAAAESGSVSRIRCPFGFLLASVPVRVNEDWLGQIEVGPLSVEWADRGRFEGALCRLGLSPGGRLRSLLDEVRVVRDAEVQGMVELVTQVAAVIAAEIISGKAGAVAQEPAAVTAGRRFAERQLGRRITLVDVARSVALSPDHFSRLFRCTTGMAFGEYMNRCRVMRAQQLLAGTSRRVAEIAFECGFESVPHFNRVFSRLTGATPTDYRRPHRKAPSSARSSVEVELGAAGGRLK